ncbi:DUF6085 family protein [Prescottella equi]|uniref:DUF6085 family protein n=1 Tax=Rhodococcus hoagii TaxID=43767 RepID=UPI000A7BF14E|nr:DUF6085 family protein [Prescottella equi]
MTDLKGYCPMGCGQTLIAFAHEGGRIECSNVDCPSPHAVDRILDDPTPPSTSEWGTDRWKVNLNDRAFEHGHINLDHNGRTMSLTGVPWTLTPADARTVAMAMLNAAAWMDERR